KIGMKNNKSILLGICCLIWMQPLFAQVIIPQPMEVRINTDVFSFKETVAIYADETLHEEAAYLSTVWQNDFHMRVALSKTPISGGIQVKKDENLKAELGDEGYELSIDQCGVNIMAATRAGVFFAI